MKSPDVFAPSDWQEDGQNWLEFRHTLTTWLAVVDPRSLQALDVVESDPGKKQNMNGNTEEGKALSKRLYGILSSYTKNRPQRVLQAIMQENCLEGYRQLLEFNASATKARSLLQIMNFRFVKEAGCSENIIKFGEV